MQWFVDVHLRLLIIDKGHDNLWYSVVSINVETNTMMWCGAVLIDVSFIFIISILGCYIPWNDKHIHI